jgi:hypothetical protein
VSARLDGLVKGRIKRTYLKGIEGFWADEVLREFAFLEERGFDLEELFFHQNGNAIRYRRDEVQLLLSYEPEYEPPGIGAGLRVDGREGGAFTPVDQLILDNDPSTRLPERPPTDRDIVRANIRFWAAGIHRLMDRPGELLG